MKFSLSWLKEYLQTNLSPEQIAETLTLIGLEVEGISSTQLSFSNVIVGKVLSVTPHPDAEKLCVAKVTDGKREYQVVCGAQNCRAGIKTAFASEGAQLTDEKGKTFQIKKTKLRGVESEGMLCAADELGLTGSLYDVHDGIMEFPEHFVEGTPLKDLFSDLIFEVAITPNLSHCASVVGIARELSSVTQEPFRFPTFLVKEDPSAGEIRSLLSVKVENPKECPRYSCRMMTDLKVGPSPLWLKNRIEQCGLRSVNNVVDVTNYVLLELGHPLHAFDYDRLSEHHLVIRNAKPGEKVQTLDGKEHFPTPETLLICDAKEPVAIAGIMGSLTSEVSEKTVRIVLESAYFEPTQVRRTSKRMGILTEASRRFERGTDPNGVLHALNRATALLQEITFGKVVKGTTDISAHIFSPKVLSCRLSRINRILGTHLALGEVEALLKRLGLKIQAISENEHIEVEVPTYRNDLSQEIDLIEEIARLYGYDHIHQHAKPPVYQSSVIPHHPLYLFEKEVRSRMVAEGLQELLTCNLISPEQASLIAQDCMPSRSLIKLLNPSSVDQSVMRPSLLPNMLQIVKYNIDHENHSLAGFEVGRVHFKTKESYLEPTVVATVLTGKRGLPHWDTKPGDFDFFDLKGIVENLLEDLRLQNVQFLSSNFENFHPGRQARIMADNHEVGIMGEVHPNTLRKVGIHQPVFFAELNLEDLMKVTKKEKRMHPLAQYPASSRDWTITLQEDYPIEKVFHLIEEQKSKIVEDVSLIDVYHHEKLGANWKNVTFRFIYRDPAQTISLKTVENEHLRITQNVLEKLKTQVV